MTDAIATSIENAALIFYGGGTISLNTGNDQVSWTEDIGLFSVMDWGKATIAAGTLNGVEDGKSIFVTISRPLNTIRVATFSVGDTISDHGNEIFFAKRVGDVLVVDNRYHSVLQGV